MSDIIIRYIVLAVVGLAGGMTISAGVFALITSTGMMSRLAGKTHTGKHVRLYEDAVMLGGSVFNALYVFNFSYAFPMPAVKWGIAFWALFAGIFVGCLAVSLAEALKSTAIFTRRIGLNNGLSFVILAAALGKMFGVIIQFFGF